MGERTDTEPSMRQKDCRGKEEVANSTVDGGQSLGSSHGTEWGGHPHIYLYGVHPSLSYERTGIPSGQPHPTIAR